MMSKILVVDDANDLHYVFSVVLERDGHQVLCVSSTDTVRSILFAFLPELIIMDVLLKGEDGRELCKEIKEKYNKDIAIILMSASNQFLKDYEEWNADAVIEKPFDIHVVSKIVNQVLNGRKNICIASGYIN